MEDLTTVLARRVMGWEVAPDRFLLGKRRWLPRWRFNPISTLEDAFQLLEAAAPRQYAMGSDGHGLFWVRVRIGRTTGRARDTSKSLPLQLPLPAHLRFRWTNNHAAFSVDE